MVPQHALVEDDALVRVRAEYREIPGLRLSQAQAQRLMGLERLACEQALAALSEAKFLRRLADGTFIRFDSR